MEKRIISFCMVICFLLLPSCSLKTSYPPEGGIWVSEEPHMQVDMRDYTGWIEVDGELRLIYFNPIHSDQFEIFYIRQMSYLSEDDILVRGSAKVITNQSMVEQKILCEISDNSLLDLGVEQILLTRDDQSSMLHPKDGVWLSEDPYIKLDMESTNSCTINIDGKLRDAVFIFEKEGRFKILAMTDGEYINVEKDILLSGDVTWSNNKIILQFDDENPLDLDIENAELTRTE